MSRISARFTVAGVFILIWAGLGALNLWQRYDEARVTVDIRNATAAVQLIRVTDATSGRNLGTWAIPSRSAVRLLDVRLDEWWSDPSIVDEASGRTRTLTLELLGSDGCELIDKQRGGHDDEPMTLGPEGLIQVSGDDEAAVLSSSVAQQTEDPCEGGPAPARGLIANLTNSTIAVGPGVVVQPCSSRIVHPGDLAHASETTGAAGASDIVHVRVPSIDAQDERWPIEPRSVVVTAMDVSDQPGGGVDLSYDGPCGGTSPTGPVEPPAF